LLIKISGQFEWTEDMLQAGPNLGRQGAIATKVGAKYLSVLRM
jgi:hypothetical protein